MASKITQRPSGYGSKPPPIRPIWTVSAAIATLVLLMLTLWRIFTPPGPPPAPEAKQQAASNEIPSGNSSPALIAEPKATNSVSGASGVDQPSPASPVADNVMERAAEKDRETLPTDAAEKAVAQAAERTGEPQPSDTASHESAPPIADRDAKTAATTVDNAPQEMPGPESVGPSESEAVSDKELAEADAALERRWLAEAEEFARRHRGRVLHNRSFLEGTLRTSPGFDVQWSDLPLCFLGGGRLETDDGVYPFGAGYQHAPPVMRQEIPQLAAKLGLASARIELHLRDDKIVIQAEATPKPVGPDAVEDTRKETVRLEDKLQRLNLLVREWRRLDAAGSHVDTATKKAQMRGSILRELEPTPSSVESAGAKEPPKDGEPITMTPPNATAEKDRDVTAASGSPSSGEVLDLADKEITRLEARIRRLQADSKTEKERLRSEGNRAVERFKNGCRKLTAVIYESVAAEPDPAEALPAKPLAPQPSSIPQPTAVREPSTASPDDLKETPGVPQVAAKFREQVSEKTFTTTNTAMARLVVQAVGDASAGLPKWFRDEYDVNCTIWQYPAEGRPWSRDVTDVAMPKAHDVTTGTTQVAVRFWLSRKHARASEADRPAAETSWHVIETVQAGAEYRVRAAISTEAIEPLRPKPIKPGGKKTR